MARGRKKNENSLVNTISIKISKEHKDVLEKNKFVKKEIDKMVRDYIDIYVMK